MSLRTSPLKWCGNLRCNDYRYRRFPRRASPSSE